MSRWLVTSYINDSFRPNKSSNKPYNSNQTIDALSTGEVDNNTFEGNEKRHDDVEIESREADTVFGVEEDEYKPFKTISDGYK